MKKSVLFICLIAMVSLGLASLGMFPEKVPPTITFWTRGKRVPDQATKYSDCIDSLELSGFLINQPKTAPKDSAASNQMDQSLKKYGASMDSVVDNLNSTEAHQFLHAAYKKYKDALGTDSLSKANTYYHIGAMQICYHLDKSLSSSSEGLAKNSK
ncbi:hypothetical protein [Flagellimonas myxillae]|uniref:hypothetical protein n=1 Tax=Flagellimonas myxillae TaxID=2942214 RepID=UPI00201F8D6E|nr:hypothetical protein [Muricauda myxillae]MCL6264986.1 hypothetical protein [Muricauda myxillae]